MKEEDNHLKADIYWEAAKLARAGKQTVGEKHDFYITLDQLNTIIMNACGYACSFQEPYGFVPEAGCPVHDM